MNTIEELRKRIAAMEGRPSAIDPVKEPPFRKGDRVLNQGKFHAYVQIPGMTESTIISFHPGLAPKEINVDDPHWSTTVVPNTELSYGWPGHFLPGDRVHWIGNSVSPKKENGIVSSLKNDSGCIRVVYKCDGNWDRYMDYTAQLSDIEYLRHGWI